MKPETRDWVSKAEGDSKASGSPPMVKDNGGQIRVTDRDEAGAKTHPAGQGNRTKWMIGEEVS